jgi:hypothetical protein
MLYTWVRQFRSEAKEAFRGNGNMTSQDEELRCINSVSTKPGPSQTS